jgi:hypothetical protein
MAQGVNPSLVVVPLDYDVDTAQICPRYEGGSAVFADLPCPHGVIELRTERLDTGSLEKRPLGDAPPALLVYHLMPPVASQELPQSPLDRPTSAPPPHRSQARQISRLPRPPARLGIRGNDGFRSHSLLILQNGHQTSELLDSARPTDRAGMKTHHGGIEDKDLVTSNEKITQMHIRLDHALAM